MSEKLCTDKIKNLIIQWLSNTELHKLIKEYYIEDIEDISDFKNTYDCINNINSLDDFYTYLISEWTNKNNWKRNSKSKLKKDYTQFLIDDNNKYYFETGFYGNYNQNLVDYYCYNSHLAKNCIVRYFSCTNELIANNFYIYVITTPEDDKIIGWGIHHD